MFPASEVSAISAIGGIRQPVFFCNFSCSALCVLCNNANDSHIRSGCRQCSCRTGSESASASSLQCLFAFQPAPLRNTHILSSKLQIISRAGSDEAASSYRNACGMILLRKGQSISVDSQSRLPYILTGTDLVSVQVFYVFAALPATPPHDKRRDIQDSSFHQRGNDSSVPEDNPEHHPPDRTPGRKKM